jgi:peroxiredoxin
MLPLGTTLPTFSLTDAASGQTVTDQSYPQAQALLVMFICNHCPFVIHVRDELTRIAKEYAARGVQVIAINANSSKTHPQDGPEAMKGLARQLGWQFPFLFDESQGVARAFQAACTPDFYVFDRNKKLVYRGQLDDSRPGNAIDVTGKDLRAALGAALALEPPLSVQKPSIGCNIKWHPGNEPQY